MLGAAIRQTWRALQTWPAAGRYYLEAASTDDKVSNPKADQRRLQYLGTVEVLPM